MEVDLDIKAKAAFGRNKFGIGAVALNAHRLHDLEIAARTRLLSNASLVNRGYELGGGAVHDRRLGSVDLDEDVVDLQAGQGRKKVLNRADAGAGRVAEHRAKFGMGHIGPFRLEQAFAPPRQPGAQKHHARIDISGLEDDLSRRPGMDTHSADRGATAKRRLKAKSHLQNHRASTRPQ